MISDTLSEAVDEMNRYLTDEVFASVYTGDTRRELLELRDRMEEMRVKLDTLPASAA